METNAGGRTLGTAIRARRRELGWTQEELADRVAARGDTAFRQSDVSRLERGKVALPHRDRLERIAAVLDLALGELLARSGWSGWSAADAVKPPTFPPPASERPASVRTSPATGDRPDQPSMPGDITRLQAARAHAQSTIARAEQIMDQSEALRKMYEDSHRT